MAGGTKSPKLTKECLRCDGAFITTVKRAWRTRYCGALCMAEHRAEVRQRKLSERRRECVVCGAAFVPRYQQIRNTGAKYCSVACGFAARAEKMSALGHAARNAALADGRIKFPTGPANKQWKGGPVETRRRRQRSGLSAASLRRYRSENPDKVREFTQSRSRRKFGRLPRGTVSDLFSLQRGRCAVCREKLPKSFHVDHRVPLVAGGKHERGNVQLLCPSCNVRKNAKDPIKFMQERGFLL